MSLLSLVLINLLVAVTVLSIVRLAGLQKNKEKVELDTQGVWESRFLGGLLDQIFAIGVSVGIIALFGKTITKFLPLAAALYFAYHLIFELACDGMTPGKKIGRVTIISVNGNRPSTTDYVVRDLIKTMPVLIAFLLPWATIQIVVKAIVVLIYLLVPVFQSKKRTLHDLVAGTTVIRKADAEELATRQEEAAEEQVEEKVVSVPEKPMKQEKPVAPVKAAEPARPVEPAKPVAPVKLLTPAVVGLSGKYEGTYVELMGSVMLGRALDCNMVFDADAAGISRKHCSVAYRPEDDTFVLTDLNSTYGTFLEDGSKLERGASKVLSEGAIFWIGDKQRFQFQKLNL